MIIVKTLENNRVRLESLEWNHFDSLLPLSLKNPDLLKFSPVEFGTEEKLRNYFKKAIEERIQGKRIPFAVFDKKMGAYAGSTSFMLISKESEVMEIGWSWISNEFQGSGLNMNMKFVMLEYLFEKLEYERAEFKTDSRNVTARKALEKLGASFEGILRNHMKMLDGHRRSSAVYSILKTEWVDIKSRSASL